MTRSYFEVLHSDIKLAIESEDKMTLDSFEEGLLNCFCQNKMMGFYARCDLLEATPGWEPHAQAALRALSAWQLSIEAIHAAKNSSGAAG
jgi:hypothetical protein